MRIIIAGFIGMFFIGNALGAGIYLHLDDYKSNVYCCHYQDGSCNRNIGINPSYPLSTKVYVYPHYYQMCIKIGGRFGDYGWSDKEDARCIPGLAAPENANTGRGDGTPFKFNEDRKCFEPNCKTGFTLSEDGRKCNQNPVTRVYSLHDCIDKKDLDCVKAAINANRKVRDGVINPICWAIAGRSGWSDYLEAIKLMAGFDGLLDRVCGVGYGHSVIIEAIRLRDVKAFELLLKIGKETKPVYFKGGDSPLVGVMERINNAAEREPYLDVIFRLYPDAVSPVVGVECPPRKLPPGATAGKYEGRRLDPGRNFITMVCVPTACAGTHSLEGDECLLKTKPKPKPDPVQPAPAEIKEGDACPAEALPGGATAGSYQTRDGKLVCIPSACDEDTHLLQDEECVLKTEPAGPDATKPDPAKSEPVKPAPAVQTKISKPCETKDLPADATAGKYQMRGGKEVCIPTACAGTHLLAGEKCRLKNECEKRTPGWTTLDGICMTSDQANQILAQRARARAESIITESAKRMETLGSGMNVSVWKDKDGKFNTARLVSDSVAGVVLGTAGGLITSSIIKKNQIKSGFEDISCSVGGQLVADWGDEFTVGVR
jgi:hypothetical protein